MSGYEEALRRIAALTGFDEEAGYIDEWTEAEAFRRAREIAQKALGETRPLCDVPGCNRPKHPQAVLNDQHEPGFFRTCALHEIASYNEDDLREWGEENAADMVVI